MVTKHSKNHQFQAIKKAVDKNELSIDQANEIIIKSKKEENKKVITTARASEEHFTKVFNGFVMKAKIQEEVKQQIMSEGSLMVKRRPKSAVQMRHRHYRPTT